MKRRSLVHPLQLLEQNHQDEHQNHWTGIRTVRHHWQQKGFKWFQMTQKHHIHTQRHHTTQPILSPAWYHPRSQLCASIFPTHQCLCQSGSFIFFLPIHLSLMFFLLLFVCFLIPPHILLLLTIFVESRSHSPIVKVLSFLFSMFYWLVSCAPVKSHHTCIHSNQDTVVFYLILSVCPFYVSLIPFQSLHLFGNTLVIFLGEGLLINVFLSWKTTSKLIH